MTSSKIKVFSRFGDPHKQAASNPYREDASGMPLPASSSSSSSSDLNPHGMSSSDIAEMHAKFEAFEPGIHHRGAGRRSMVQDLLDRHVPGAAVGVVNKTGQLQGMSLGGGSSFGGGGNTLVTPQRPFQPEFDNSSYQSYPVSRLLANRYWRLMFKMEPIVQTCIRMMAEMVWSAFSLTGEGVDGEIKTTLEHMVEETQLRAILPFLVQEFLVLGEVAPHCFWDDVQKIWTHITCHNPDQLEIIYSPFVKMDPVAEFVPDDKLRQVVTSPNPQLRRIREMMPPELIARLSSRQNIPLNPLNFTFLARKMHPYDVRGTSILSSLWSLWMASSAMWSSFIATCRRASRPLKVLKVGDAASNYIPGPEVEQKMLRMLTQAEADCESWIVCNYANSFELVGDPQRAVNVATNYDLIERIQLAALGVSKGLLSGEVTYASSAAGLTVFLQRLLAMRDYFESAWIYPKFFKPVAVMNNWIKPTEAELAHKVRTKRSKRELMEEDRYIIPQIEWEKSLDPAANTERISAITALQQIGIKVSRRTALATVGLDFEQELKQIKAEQKVIQDIVGNDLQTAAAAGIVLPGMAPTAPGGEGGAGMAVSPGLPAGSMGEFSPAEEGGGEGGGMMAEPPASGGDTVPIAPEGAEKVSEEGGESQKPPVRSLWQDDILHSLNDLFENFDHAELVEPWDRMLMDSSEAQRAVKMEDPQALWEAIQQWLVDEGYPTKAIIDLEATLASKGKIVRAKINHDAALEKVLSDVGLNGSSSSSFLVGGWTKSS